MKFDCYAFVDAHNRTLLTRGPFASLLQLRADQLSLQARRASEGHHGPVFVLRSFTNEQGTEVATQLYTKAVFDELARDEPSPVVAVGVLLAKERGTVVCAPAGATLDASQYTLHATLLVPENGALDHAYSWTQQAKYGWNPAADSSKTAPGDVFILNGEAFLVDEVNFRRVHLA